MLYSQKLQQQIKKNTPTILVEISLLLLPNPWLDTRTFPTHPQHCACRMSRSLCPWRGPPARLCLPRLLQVGLLDRPQATPNALAAKAVFIFAATTVHRGNSIQRKGVKNGLSKPVPRSSQSDHWLFPSTQTLLPSCFAALDPNFFLGKRKRIRVLLHDSLTLIFGGESSQYSFILNATLKVIKEKNELQIEMNRMIKHNH